ncbi:MAG: cation-translocating P-type ATPase [Rhodobacteraceae bacterium]|nr:cation-translocating P-type ATPase [Paracoccaceae bacterium]
MDAACDRLGTARIGLTKQAAAERLKRFGANTIIRQARRAPWRMVLDQFTDLLIMVLIAAAAIAGLLGEPQDSIIILIIVLLNAMFGAVQEYRAERAVAALRRMAAAEAVALRDAAVCTLAADQLVPGDVVFLEAGNAVPADLRLIEGVDLQTDESLLTGESTAAEKNTDPLDLDILPVSERANLAFKGTLITQGRGRGLVVATGMQTELGQIADLLSKTGLPRTPLQERLAHFGGRLAVSIMAICALVFAIGLFRGEAPVLMFLTAVSLAVAAIPEALPAVVTVSLALGAAKLSRKNVLIRRLPAVETLGAVTYICADKTGTLTKNEMHLERIVIGETVHERLAMAGSPSMQLLGKALALCNEVHSDEQGRFVGDPTEVALYQAALAAGHNKQDLEKALPRIAELPFNSERKRMSTLHQDDDKVLMFSKGAPEYIIPQCNSYIGGEPFDGDNVLRGAARLADSGYRVLALACRRLKSVPVLQGGETESQLSFLGLVALIDPPREGVKAAVAECQAAGIVPVMITGDHPGTARAIALRLAICEEADDVLTGVDLELMSSGEFEALVEQVRVYARVSPEQKIRIVRALMKRGQFAAMTGDGVNDAPALKMANIGVAMGKKGTDVAREAADMVLLDDNFNTIVSAIREGRRIYDNIRKFIKDTMSSNSGEIWTLLLAPLFGLPIPLLPIHILWINLVTDGLPGLAFTTEPAEPGVMRRPPRAPDESILARGMWQHIVWVGLFVAAVSIASQAWAFGRGVAYWQTVVFTVLTVSQLFHSMAIRSETESLITIGILSNPAMLGAVVLTIALQLTIIYLPIFNEIFHTQPLPLFDLGVCFALSTLTLVAVEIEKLLVRLRLLFVQDSSRQRKVH